MKITPEVIVYVEEAGARALRELWINMCSSLFLSFPSAGSKNYIHTVASVHVGLIS